MRLAVDAMGGDFAPTEIVLGAIDALDLLGDDHQLVLLGVEEIVRRELDISGHIGWQDKLGVIDAPEIVAMDDPPVAALKQKRKSSIALMAAMAARGEVDALISAGNTGAFVAACQMKIRPLPGVSRPGIVVALPTCHGPVALCDAGANIAPKAHHLHQYAVMASLYAERVLGISNPRVAILSVGQEAAKGNKLVRRSAELLAEDERIHFVGNVEGRDIYHGACDVVICDGFSGNVIVKLSEGLAEELFETVSRQVKESKPDLAPEFEEIVQSIWSKHDYSEHGGAPLLGVDAVCAVCHGRSTRRAIRNAVRVAVEFSQLGLNEAISKACQ